MGGEVLEAESSSDRLGPTDPYFADKWGSP